jgi:hypothetical protein
MTTPLDPPLDPDPRLSQPESPASSSEPQRPRRVLFSALIALGAVLIAGGGAATIRELTRSATPAEAAAALQQEIGTRWERLPAGKIFPATISYPDADGNPTVAHLVGIAPPASCRAALGATGYANFRRYGCATILRATYVDGSGALVATVGIAVVRTPTAAGKAATIAASLGANDGLDTVAFGGTISGQFADTARGIQGGIARGPYVFLFTAGFADGQPGVAALQQDAALTAFGTGVDTGLAAVLTRHGKPCQMKDIKC